MSISMVFTFVQFAFEAYYMMILANILLSWFPGVKPNAITNFIYEMTEPFLKLFRGIIPISPKFPIDFSPILAIIVLSIMQNLAYKLLIMLMF